MYKLLKDYRTNEIYGANKIEPNTMLSFLFDPSNTDYQNFKAQINADEAELQDADGKEMTAQQAKAFVATLP